MQFWIFKIYRYSLIVVTIMLNSLKLNLDPHFPDLNKCVPERECPSNKPGMEVPDIPEDMPSGIQPKYDI